MGDSTGTGVAEKPVGAADDPPLAPVRPPPAVTEVVRNLTVFLAVGMVGVVLLLAGLVWDALLHARDPEAVHREGGLFTLSSRPHLLLLVGGGLAIGSLTMATAQALSVSPRRRLASRRTGAVLIGATLAMVAATGGAIRWASSDQRPPLASGPLAPPPGPDRHGIDIVNSHASGECRPTKAEKAGAAKLLADTRRGTARYASLSAALADGYVAPATPSVTDHYPNPAFTQDGKVLDPSRPESLMYTLTAHGPVLVGVMYVMNVPGEFGPEPGGCLTRWHVHANLCYSPATFQPVAELSADGTCPPDTFRYIPPPLLHVWFVDVPGGRFAAEVDSAYLARAVGP